MEELRTPEQIEDDEIEAIIKEMYALAAQAPSDKKRKIKEELLRFKDGIECLTGKE